MSRELLQHGQFPTAETYLRECPTIREKKLPDDWVHFNTKSMLGGALAGQKNPGAPGRSSSKAIPG